MSIKAKINTSKSDLTISASAELEVVAAAPTEGNGKKLATVKMTAYTGGAMDLFGWDHPLVVDLAGMRIKPRRPFLRDHDAGQIVGHAEIIEVNNGRRLRAEGTISGASEHARQVAESALNGFPWQVSVGCKADNVNFHDKGETVMVNGQSFRGPIYVAARSTLKEISFVALGADDETTARVAARAHNKSETTMTFDQWLKAQGLSTDGLDEAKIAELKAKYEADEGDDESEKPETKPVKAAADKPEPEPDPAFAERRKALAAETRRVAAVMAACKGKYPEIEAKAIEGGWPAERAELEVLRAERPKAPAASSGNGKAHTPAVIEAALCLRSGITDKIVAGWYGQEAVDRATTRDFRGEGIHSLMYAVTAAAGGYIRPGRIDDDAIRAAFTADRNIRASGGFSTVGSLSGILGNVANKTLLASFQAVQTVVPLIAAEADHNDFKKYTKFRLTGAGVFEKVPADGEIKHAAVDTEAYENQIDTYGKMFALTRQMIINDDLGAFLQIPRMLGRMAALGRERAVFEMLLSNPVGADGEKFFSPAHKNLNYGSDSDLDIDSLAFAERKFLDQVDVTGNPILLNPSAVLVPTSLKIRAQQLMVATTLVGTTTAARPILNSNPFAGRFAVVPTPYLNSQALTGSSRTAWYLFADPNDIAAIEVAYLRGQRTPVIESGDTDFNTLGMQWRGYWDFGVALQDYRAAVKSNGATASGDDTLTGGEGDDTIGS